MSVNYSNDSHFLHQEGSALVAAYTVTEFIVKGQLTVDDLYFKVFILQPVGIFFCQPAYCQIMGGYTAQGRPGDYPPDNAYGPRLFIV